MPELPKTPDIIDTTPAQRAQRELARRVANERCRYYTPSGRAEQFLGHLKNIKPHDPRIITLILRAGNRFGKSALACNLAAYLARGKPNPWFDSIPYLQQFKRPNRGRIYTTANSAKNTWDDEVQKWFPSGAFTVSKEGTTFNKKIRFMNKSVFDFFTFDQAISEAQSISLQWQISDEPPPRKLWSAMRTRMDHGGLMVFVLTPLEDAAWMADELEIPERLGDDVFVTVASTEDACIEHGVRGHLPHASIESIFKDFDEAEMAACKSGEYLHLSGRIYKTYRAEPDAHCPVDIHPYHMDEWERGPGAGWTLWNVMDPHDRKPFAIGWYAAFRNGDVYTIAEWPDDAWPPFHKMKDCSYVPKDYARMIVETERALGVRDAGRGVRRFIDPNFGNTPCFLSNTTIKQELSAEGTKLGYSLNFQDPPDSLEGGHIAVKALLGDIAKGVRPKYYDLAHCKNHIYGMTRYGWAENRNEKKGVSEKPELLHKDFADLKRYLALAKVKFIELLKAENVQRASSYGKPGYRGV